MTLETMRKRQKAILIKILNGLTAPYLSEMFTHSASFHDYGLRSSKMNLALHKSRTYLLGLMPSGLFMGLSSTLICTSELILCSTICVPSATRYNIHMYP